MRYAKVENGKVIEVVNGLQPKGYVEVSVDWVMPDDYPSVFYSPRSRKPIYTIIKNKVHENWDFSLKDISNIKAVIYEKLRKTRYKKQLGSFDLYGKTITLNDREDGINIANIGPNAEAYKLRDGDWIETKEEILLLKIATLNHVQSAFDWELSQTNLVKAMTTLDELKTYFESL